MTEPAASTRRRLWSRVLLYTVGSVIVLFLAGLWYVTTDSFQSLVRRRLVAEIERISGGHAEVGSFHTVPLHMLVDVRNITVHGREGANDVPLAHADRLVAELKVISFLRTEFGFNEVVLDHPVVHIAFYPDNTTNIPGAAIHQAVAGNPTQRLFALSIDKFDVRHGELIWDNQTVPLNFTLHDSDLQMDYSHLHSRYDGRLLLGKVDTKFDDFRPFAWMTTLQFNFSSSFAEIKSIDLHSGKSRIQANGRVDNFRSPQVRGDYDTSLDLGEWAAIMRRPQLREGTLELKGSGSWSLEKFAAIGSAALRDLHWQDAHVQLTKASGSSEYSISDDEVKLTKLQGKILDGSFAGDAQIEHWMNFSQPSSPPVTEGAVIRAAKPRAKAQKTKEIQSGVLRLHLRDVSAAGLVNALNRAGHPFGRFRPAGFATGSLEARWRGTPRAAEVGFVLDVNPPLHPAKGELPVMAHLQGTYSTANDELALAKALVTAPQSRIQAAGRLSRSSSLRVSVSTSNLDELRPVIAILHGPADVPFTIHGNATFNGLATGSPESPGFSGSLMAQDFDFTLPATSQTPEKDVHWDSLSAGLQYTSSGMTLRNGNLRRGDTSAEFEVSSSLQDGEFTMNSPFTARINLQNVDVPSTAALAGYDYPVTGTADIFLELGGTRSNPRVQGKIHANNASAYGESIDQFDASLNVANGETALNDIHLIHDGAVVSGSAAFTPSTRQFKLDLAGNNFDLAEVRQIPRGRVDLQGRGDFTLRASGTPGKPVINASAHVRNLTLDRELQGDLDVDAVSSGNDLHLSGHSSFPHGALALDGSIAMRNDYPVKLVLRSDHLDLDFLWLAYLRGTLTGHSAVGGTLTFEGPLRDWRNWKVAGDLNDVSVDVEYAKLHNDGPLRFHYAQQKLQIEQLHMAGETTDLAARGSVEFADVREINLSADGHVDLKLLNRIDPDITASGLLSVNMSVGGTLSDPYPQGRLQVSNTSLAYAGVPSGLSEMNGSLVFTRERLHIETLTARTGGGTLDLRGDATAYSGQLNFDLTAVAKDVRLRYPPGVSSTATAQLRWAGSQSASTVSGDILVNKLAVTPNFDFSSYLGRSRQIGTVTAVNSPLQNVKLDIRVQTAPELQMKTAVARLSGDADLRLRGSVARPTVLGRADILEGQATFNGTKFNLERGDITFSNPVTIEPLVNLQASARVRKYELNVTITGTPDRLAINYRSEPPLPKSDILAMLALGRSAESGRLQEQQQYTPTPFADEATTAMILNQAINATETSRVQKLFGASRIRIDPQGLTTETNPTARGPQVTIEQQFANNISLTYSTNVSQTGEQIIQGEYFLTPNISTVGTRDQNGVVSFDLRVRRHKK